MENQEKQMKEHETFFGAFVDFWQFVCCLAGNCGWDEKRVWSREKRNRVRTSLFFFFFVYMVLIYNQGFYQGKAYFKYHGIVFCVVLYVTAFVSREKKLAPVKWHSLVARLYLLFWLLACVSDFVVSKRFKFVGYVMLLGMGMVFLAWQQMEHKEDMIKSFCRALELFAAVGIIYNILRKTQISGLPYRGYMKNTGEFAIFSALLVLVFLTELYGCWQSGRFGKAFLLYLCGAACSVLQVVLSGKWYAMLYAGILVFLALIGAVKGYVRLPSSARKKVAGYTVIAVLICFLYLAAVWDASWDLHAVFTGENWGRRLRIAKENVKAVSLFGHKQPNLKSGRKWQNPQNNILQVCYRYGLLATIPYVLLFGLALKKAVYTLLCTRKKWDSTDLLAAGVFVFWWTVGFFANTEFPYYQPVWFLAYLMLGRYMAGN